MYTCIVCGYDKLSEPPYDEYGCPSYEICNCCGFEFGFDDQQGLSIEDFRKEWIKQGAIWFCEEKKPSNWDLNKQLKNIK